MNHIKGFSLLEVLITLGLLSFILFNVEAVYLRSMAFNQQAWFQTIAIEQLNQLAILYRVYHGRFNINVWNEENADFLPKGYGEIDYQGDSQVGRVYWGNDVFQFWHCSTKSKIHFACIERKFSDEIR